MSATPVVFNSSDVGAPVINGLVSSFIVACRAMLVGSGGFAYGSVPSLGWTEPFAAASNAGTFRNNHTLGSGAYFNMKDDASTAGAGRTVVVRGYRNMTALNTGTDPFPSLGQEVSALYVNKSTTADATARNYWAIGTRKWFYIFIDSAGIGQEFAAVYFFGDLDTIRPGDAFHPMIAAGRISSPSTTQFRTNFLNSAGAASLVPVGTTTGAYIAGTYSQVASSTGIALLAPYGLATTIGGTPPAYSYPHGPNSGLLYSRIGVHEAAYTLRGWMPGVLAPHHNRVLTDFTSLPDIPEVGKTSISRRFSARADGSVTGSGELIFDLSTAY